MTCNICWEEIEPELFLVTEHEKINSTMCLECIEIIIKQRLDSYIEHMFTETCSTASANMYKCGLPKYLSVNGTGFGTIVKSYEYKSSVYSGLLCSNKTDDEMKKINDDITSVQNVLKNDT